MAEKWNANHILRFLDIYEKHQILWDIKHEDYNNKYKRKCAFQKVIKELEFKGITLEILRKKIKTIKTVYRQEFMKIVKSRKHDPENIYKPKLSWYDKADSFLNGVTIIRPSNSSLDIESLNVDDLLFRKQHEEGKPIKQFLLKKPKGSIINIRNGSLSKLRNIIDKDDEFEIFGSHIAAQLRKLPIKNALILEEQIQSLITKERISCIKQASYKTEHFNTLSPTNSDSSNLTDTKTSMEEVIESIKTEPCDIYDTNVDYLIDPIKLENVL